MAPTKKTTGKKAPAKKAPAKKTASKSSAATSKNKGKKVTQEQIRARAYEIYKESGSKDGLDEEHWLQAEKELLNK